jgi:hypothetical protein
LPGEELLLDLPIELDALLAVLDALSEAREAAVLAARAGSTAVAASKVRATRWRRGMVLRLVLRLGRKVIEKLL